MKLEHDEFDPFRFHRGAFIGRVAERIIEEAEKIGLPVSGRGRKIRLALASALVDREVTSYNDLDNQELWDIEAWTYNHRAELREWLVREYGYQDKLL